MAVHGSSSSDIARQNTRPSDDSGDAALVRDTVWRSAGAHHKEDNGEDACEYSEDKDCDARDQQQLLAGRLGPDVGLRTRPDSRLSLLHFHDRGRQQRP